VSASGEIRIYRDTERQWREASHLSRVSNHHRPLVQL
jgi:hypothetical protein